MTKRKSMLKPSAFSWVALKAAIGAEKAIPVRTATGIASRIAGECVAPNRVMIATKIVATIVRRTAIQASWPMTMSFTPIGVASIAT